MKNQFPFHQKLGSMKNKVLIAGSVASLAVLLPLFVHTLVILESQPAYAQTDGYRYIAQNAFGFGEELTFDVNYGFVTAGTATMAIMQEPTFFGGRKCFNVQFNVTSKPFFDNFYKVRDHYESHIDAASLFPWRFVQQIREGGYSRDFYANFDHKRLKAITPKDEYPIPENVQDILSAFYFMRTQSYDKVKPGQKMYLKNFYKDSTFVLTVKYLGKQQIKVAAGTFNTILLEPIMKEGGLFKSSGRITVWLTDDERKIPVQVDAQIPIGSITSELTWYKGTAGPIKAKVK
jgi:hypothetical protein